jgi:branched-chain amino acid aminotransferase
MVDVFEVDEGRLVPLAQAPDLAAASERLPQGSYTTLRTYGGNGVVRLGQHARRLEESLPRPASLPESAVRRAVAEALRATRHPESRVRLTFATPRLFVAVEPFAPADPALADTGVACRTLRGRRERPKAKDTRFLETLQIEYAALPAMVHEALLVDDDGAVLEGLSSNFFGIRDGRLYTEEARALAGVTRAMVLELAAGIVPRGEGPVLVKDLPSLAEAFITSVSREILPVVRIDGTTVGDGRPGPVTRRLMAAFADAVAREAERLS